MRTVGREIDFGAGVENALLQSVAVLFHPRRRRAVEEAEWLGVELQKRGVQVTVASGWDSETLEHVCCDRQLIITLGGDGTIIHIARIAAPYNVPLVGINLGRVGFLAEMTPEALHERVDEMVEERFWIERRTMLEVQFRTGGEMRRSLCVNEVAVARGLAPRAIQVRTALDGHEFMTYTADGVLIVTATGSTAYSLAAGGPILYPESRDFMLTPVAPHLHIGRSMIVPGDTVVEMTVSSDRPAVVSVDGTDEHPLQAQDRVEVTRSDLFASFARFGERQYFYSAIAARLK